MSILSIIENFNPETIVSNDGKRFIHCSALIRGEFCLPDGITDIGIEAFAGCRQLTAIKIPASTYKISFLAFSKCTGLKSITVFNRTNVVSVAEDAFTDIDKSSCMLMVPENMVFAYRNDKIWSEFKNIICLDENKYSFYPSLENIRNVI